MFGGARLVAEQARAFSAGPHTRLGALVNATPVLVAVGAGRVVAIQGCTDSGGTMTPIDVVTDPPRLRQLAARRRPTIWRPLWS